MTILLFSLVSVLTFLNESLVEYIAGTPMDKSEKLKPYKWLLMYLAMVTGVLLSFYFKVDLIAMLPVWLAELLQYKEIPAYAPTTVGLLLTGLSIGRGSNFLHQLMAKFFPVKPQQT